MKSPRHHLAEAEWVVMKTLWAKSPLAAQDVIDAVAPAAGWSPATVKTLLNRLLRKGALRFVREGRAYLYSPRWTREDCSGDAAQSFLERVFDGSLSPLLAHFVQSRRLSRKELAELRRILEDRP
jgi:predicted transcriptional regulator